MAIVEPSCISIFEETESDEAARLCYVLLRFTWASLRSLAEVKGIVVSDPIVLNNNRFQKSLFISVPSLNMQCEWVVKTPVYKPLGSALGCDSHYYTQ